MRAADESKLMSGFLPALTPADHDARMDMLLGKNATSTAVRQLAFVSPSKRSIFEARIAFRTRAADAALKGAAGVGHRA